jgi:cell division protease FtsH
VKQVIDSSIVGFYRHQDSLRKLGVEMKRGILFHSPPGTGKTSISLYLARLLPNFTVCFVSGRRLLYPRELCSMARYLQPAMLVFEDIDLIAADRDVNGVATVLGELMNQIDGCEPTDQVLFIMNTNSMDRIEMAVRDRPGRVDQIIHLPLPNTAARRELLAHFARNMCVEPSHLDRAASATDGTTPAALKELVKRAAVLSLQRQPAGQSAGQITITDSDMLLAYEQIQRMRPTKSSAGQIL